MGYVTDLETIYCKDNTEGVPQEDGNIPGVNTAGP